MIGLLLAFFALQAEARDAISCSGFSTMYDENISVSVDAAWKNLQLSTSETSSQRPVIAVRSVTAPADLAGYFACEDEQKNYSECRAKYEAGLSAEEVDTLTTLLFVESWRTNPVFADSPNHEAYQAFPILQVRKIEEIVVEENQGTGSTGLVNFYDAQDILLGRFFQELEPVPCR